MKKTAAMALVLVGIVVLFVLTKPKTNVEMPAEAETRRVSPETGMVYIGKTEISVDIADSPQEMERGLSGREQLLPGYGMLFFLPFEQSAGFWMKDMKFAIDIIWIDAEKKIIHIEHSVAPETYPASFRSEGNALYVLEVPAGFSKDSRIGVGDVVRF